MKYNIVYSPEALRDLDQTWEHIFEELFNPDAAQRIVQMVLDTVDLFCEQPFLGTMLSVVTDVESDYRFLVCEHYLAFYRIEDQGIYIDRVLHEKQNYIRVLFGDKRD